MDKVGTVKEKRRKNCILRKYKKNHIISIVNIGLYICNKERAKKGQSSGQKKENNNCRATPQLILIVNKSERIFSIYLS